MSAEKALAQLQSHHGEVSDKRATTEGTIRNTFTQLRKVLNAREAELVSQLDLMTQKWLRRLESRKKQIETTLAELNDCLHLMRESKTGRKKDLFMNAKVCKKTHSLTETLKPNSGMGFKFLVDSDAVTTACQTYGQLLASSSPDPSKCLTRAKNFETKIVGKKSIAFLEAIDFNGEPCTGPIKSLECELLSELNGAGVQCNVEKKGQGLYEVCYIPSIKGKHKLHVKIHGQHVRKSPFSITVRLPFEKMGPPVQILSAMQTPWGIAISRKGEVVVIEWDGHRISVLSPDGKKLRFFGTHGSGQGQFENPRGVAVDDQASGRWLQQLDPEVHGRWRVPQSCRNKRRQAFAVFFSH